MAKVLRPAAWNPTRFEPAKNGSDAADLDDAQLARRAAANDAEAWAEFVRRFEPLLRRQLRRALAGGGWLLSSDSVDDALGEYWIALVKDDRAWLRRFDPARGHPLGKWLGVLAWGVGNKHLRSLRRHRSARRMESLDLEHEPWHDRGARFMACVNAIKPDAPVSKRFKWR